MAKKDLSSLMNGLMGNSQPAQTSEVTDEMRDALEARRRKNVGRPRKGAAAEKAPEVRATFIVDPDLIRKIKYISLVDGALLKDVINTALTDYIAAWESANSPIRLPKK